ncbi:putative methyltransferase [Nymphaea thermarum]|nr:putative methyltransferase [Nymphaea thermarum]
MRKGGEIYILTQPIYIVILPHNLQEELHKRSLVPKRDDFSSFNIHDFSSLKRHDFSSLKRHVFSFPKRHDFSSCNGHDFSLDLDQINILSPGARRVTCAEELFNHRHSSLRTTVERAFGLLNGRFPILKTQVPYPYRTQVAIVLATCVLHNFIIDHNPQVEQFDVDESAFDNANECTSNVPYDWINSQKSNQNWLRKQGEKFLFPGSGTIEKDSPLKVGPGISQKRPKPLALPLVSRVQGSFNTWTNSAHDNQTDDRVFTGLSARSTKVTKVSISSYCLVES